MTKSKSSIMFPWFMLTGLKALIAVLDSHNCVHCLFIIVLYLLKPLNWTLLHKHFFNLVTKSLLHQSLLGWTIWRTHVASTEAGLQSAKWGESNKSKMTATEDTAVQVTCVHILTLWSRVFKWVMYRMSCLETSDYGNPTAKKSSKSVVPNWLNNSLCWRWFMNLINWLPGSVCLLLILLRSFSAENAAAHQRAALDLSIIDFLTWVTQPGWQQGLIERAVRLRALSETRLQPQLKAPATSFISARV